MQNPSVALPVKPAEAHWVDWLSGLLMLNPPTWCLKSCWKRWGWLNLVCLNLVYPNLVYPNLVYPNLVYPNLVWLNW